MPQTPDLKSAEDSEFERRVAERRRELLGAISPEARAYLALAPIWTRELADQCKFVKAGEWEDFRRQAQSMGLMELEDTFTALGEPTLQFWMPDAKRRTVLDDLRADRSAGRQFLHEMASEAGQRIADQLDAGIYVPAATKRWAQLARLVDSKKVDTTVAANQLTTQIETQLEEERTDQALDWLRCGEDLAMALRGQMEANTALGKRRIELAFRRALDKRYLARFVPRERQIQAFEDLVAGKDGHWALHYLGMGGVGKTMLLRHINYYKPDRENAIQVPTCRIDFDILSPHFPVRRPGELLLALAQDLRRLFTHSEQEGIYKSLEDLVKSFHRALGDAPPPDEPLAHLKDPRFESIVLVFADLLKRMPKPVVLILDTCEELVKSQFGDELPHLKATFSIMERVHNEIGEMRVIFAGRRLLAQGGDGWSVPADERPGAKSYLLERQPQLRLYLMRGFDDGEADRLFDEYPQRGVRMPEDMREAIRDVSPEVGTPARVLTADGRPMNLTPDLYQRVYHALETSAAFQQRVELDRLFEDEHLRGWRDQLPESESPAEMARSTLYLLLDERTDDGQYVLDLLLRHLATSPGTSEAERGALEGLSTDLTRHLKRYNPYTLNIYSQWYQDDDKLTANMIRSGRVDPYIEMRIIKRITEKDVRTLLPAVVELRYLDAEMLKPAYSGDDRAFEVAFGALSSQEWMRYGQDPASGEAMLHIDRNLYPMLRRYYEATDDEALAEARKLLGPPLAQRVKDSTMRELGLVRLNAALSVLPDDEAAGLWSQVELKIGEEGDWTSAQRIIRFLLGSEVGAAGGRPSLLRAAVLATQAAARLQRSPGYDPSGDWDAVAQTLGEIDPGLAATPTGRWLGQRAALGRIAAIGESGRLVAEEQKKVLNSILREHVLGSTEALSAVQREQRTASLLAAVEGLLDWVDTTGERILLDYFTLEGLGWGRGPSHPDPFAQSLAARAAGQWGEWDDAIDGMESANDEATLAEDTWWGQRKPWADWDAPVSRRDRIRLEMLRLLPGEPPLDKVSPWLEEAAKPPERLLQIDSECLRSAILLRSLARKPMPEKTLARLEEQLAYVPGRRPVCAAHREIPPLFVTLARGWFAAGDVARASALLSAHLGASLEAGDDPGTVASVRKEQLAIARRMRKREDVRRLRAEIEQAGLSEQILADRESWAAAVLSGALHPEDLPTPEKDWSNEDLHAWWRCQSDRQGKGWSWPRPVEEMLEAQWAGFPPRPEALTLLALALDEWERRLLAGERVSWKDGLRDRVSSWLGQAAGEYRDQLRPAHAAAVLRLTMRGAALNYALDEGSIWTASVGEKVLRSLDLAPVGARRAAEIALEEGELLALRMPLQAARLLVQSRQWFRDAGDALGAIQAGILATGALVRSGQEAAAHAELAATRASYERFKGPDLPAWSDLEEMARESPAEAADRWIQREWGEWLVRLLSCVDWEAGGGVAGEKGESVRLWRWMKDRYGKALVPELYVAPPEQAYVEEEPEPVRLAAEASPLVWILLGLFALVISLGVLVGAFLAFRWLVNTITGGISTWWSIGLYVLLWSILIIVLGGRRALLKRIRAWLAQGTEVYLDIASRASTQPRALRWRGIPVFYRLYQGPRWKTDLWPPSFSLKTEPRETECTGRAILGQAYAEAARGIGGELSKELVQLQTLMHRRPLPVPLYTSEGLGAYPWEALLTLPVPESAQYTGREVLQFYRTVERGRIDQGSWSGEVQIIASERWAGLVEGSWEPLHAEVTTAGGLIDLWDLEAIKVLHLVGRPVQTSAGVRLQVEGDVYEMMSSAQQDADRRGGALIDAWDLPLVRTWLAIVQAEPAEGTSRNQTKRLGAALLRTLADGMFLTDVQAVITVPALPPGVARDVLACLAAQLNRRTPLNRKRLLAAAARMRDVIRNAEGEREDLQEMALDVCVFWRPRTEEEEHSPSR